MSDKIIKENLSAKYLTFNLTDEIYGVDVGHILQIIAIPGITPIPKTPDFVKGVINLRGRIIPVIDLRLKFRLAERAYDERTSIIIVKITEDDNTLYIGVIVDTVMEVLDITQEYIEDKPSFGVELDTEFILGMAKVKNKIITLLDIKKILTKDELILLNKE